MPSASRALIADLPEVLECYALTGEMDYHLKVVTPDLAGLSHFVNDVLLPHDSVQHVKTSIVLETLKDFQGLPVRQRGRHITSAFSGAASAISGFRRRQARTKCAAGLRCRGATSSSAG